MACLECCDVSNMRLWWNSKILKDVKKMKGRKKLKKEKEKWDFPKPKKQRYEGKLLNDVYFRNPLPSLPDWQSASNNNNNRKTYFWCQATQYGRRRNQQTNNLFAVTTQTHRCRNPLPCSVLQISYSIVLLFNQSKKFHSTGQKSENFFQLPAFINIFYDENLKFLCYNKLKFL